MTDKLRAEAEAVATPAGAGSLCRARADAARRPPCDHRRLAQGQLGGVPELWRPVGRAARSGLRHRRRCATAARPSAKGCAQATGSSPSTAMPIAAAVADFWADLGTVGRRRARRLCGAGARRRPPRPPAPTDGPARSAPPRELTLPNLYYHRAARPAGAAIRPRRGASFVIRFNDSLGDDATIAAFDRAMARAGRASGSSSTSPTRASGGNTSDRARHPRLVRRQADLLPGPQSAGRGAPDGDRAAVGRAGAAARGQAPSRAGDGARRALDRQHGRRPRDRLRRDRRAGRGRAEWPVCSARSTTTGSSIPGQTIKLPDRAAVRGRRHTPRAIRTEDTTLRNGTAARENSGC